MNREVHVRFDGSGRGKFPPATLQRCRKRQGNPCQVSTTELSESEPSDDASTDVTMTSEPGMGFFPGISLAGSSRSWLGGVRRKGGKNVAWALVRNSGTSRVVASPEIGGNGSTPRPKSRRREYRMRCTGADCGVVAMKGL